MFKIPVCAAIPAELMENGLQVRCVPCGAHTVLSTVAVSFCERDFPSYLTLKRSNLMKVVDMTEGNARKHPWGALLETNTYHTVSYNPHEGQLVGFEPCTLFLTLQY